MREYSKDYRVRVVRWVLTYRKAHAFFYAGVVKRSNTADCKSAGLCLRGFESLPLHHSLALHNSGVTKNHEAQDRSRRRLRGENCQWQFARKSSDENLFSIAKFRGRRRWLESQEQSRLNRSCPDSSVVERIHGKDEVVSSILTQGSMWQWSQAIYQKLHIQNCLHTFYYK